MWVLRVLRVCFHHLTREISIYLTTPTEIIHRISLGSYCRKPAEPAIPTFGSSAAAFTGARLGCPHGQWCAEADACLGKCFHISQRAFVETTGRGR